MGFSRQEYWSGQAFPAPGGLPDPGTEPVSPALQADSTAELPERLIGQTSPDFSLQLVLPPELRSRPMLPVTYLIADLDVSLVMEKSKYPNIFCKLRSWHPVPSLHGK